MSDRLGRRRFFRRAGGAVLLGAGGLLAWNLVGYSIPNELASRLVALNAKEILIVEAIAARLLRADADDLPGITEVDLLARIDDLVARLSPGQRRDLRRLLHLIEHGVPLSGGYVTRFTRLGGEAQDEILEGLERSSVHVLRGGFAAIKSLCVMAYFSHPRTWAAIGYDGPLVRRPLGGWSE